MLIFTTNGKINLVNNVDSICTTSDQRFNSTVMSEKREYKADQTVEELISINYPELKEKIRCLESTQNATKEKSQKKG